MGDLFEIDSAAASREEIGGGVPLYKKR